MGDVGDAVYQAEVGDYRWYDRRLITASELMVSAVDKIDSRL